MEKRIRVLVDEALAAHVPPLMSHLALTKWHEGVRDAIDAVRCPAAPTTTHGPLRLIHASPTLLPLPPLLARFFCSFRTHAGVSRLR
eukprot:1004602-Prymnesium_polylepis.2